LMFKSQSTVSNLNQIDKVTRTDKELQSRGSVNISSKQSTCFQGYLSRTPIFNVFDGLLSAQ
jgi:hypothetical protein